MAHGGNSFVRSICFYLTNHKFDGWFEGVGSGRKSMAAFDFIIAATALEHSLALVTRNIRNFEHAPVVLINKWFEV